MAREPCMEEYCWEEQEVLGYKPAASFKLLAYPSNVCLPPYRCEQSEPMCCPNSKEAKDRIAYYRFLRESGFSLLMLGTSFCDSIFASEAGWTKDQIVIIATGVDIHELAHIDDRWNKNWADRHNGPPPPFHGVFYDEPQDTEYNTISILEWNWTGKDIIAPNFPRFLFDDGFLEKFCSHDYYDEDCFFNRWFHSGELDRFWIMSLFIHECLGTTLTIGEYNTWWNNYYKDVINLSREHPYPHGGKGEAWVDAVVYTDYAGQLTDEWDYIEELGGSGGKQFISLCKNMGRMDDWLNAALNRNYSELWMFFQPNEPSKRCWQTCEKEYQKIIVFREYAIKHGMIIPVGPMIRKCSLREIPGCKDKVYLLKHGGGVGSKISLPNYSPWEKGEIYP